MSDQDLENAVRLAHDVRRVVRGYDAVVVAAVLVMFERDLKVINDVDFNAKVRQLIQKWDLAVSIVDADRRIRTQSNPTSNTEAGHIFHSEIEKLQQTEREVESKVGEFKENQNRAFPKKP